jgi:hypothetical protein
MSRTFPSARFLPENPGARRVRRQIGVGLHIVAFVTLVSLSVDAPMAAGDPSDPAPPKTEDPHSKVPVSPLCLLTKETIACPDFALACKKKTRLRAGEGFTRLQSKKNRVQLQVYDRPLWVQADALLCSGHSLFTKIVADERIEATASGKKLFSEDFLSNAFEGLELPLRKRLAGIVVSLVFDDKTFVQFFSDFEVAKAAYRECADRQYAVMEEEGTSDDSDECGEEPDSAESGIDGVFDNLLSVLRSVEELRKQDDAIKAFCESVESYWRLSRSTGAIQELCAFD